MKRLLVITQVLFFCLASSAFCATITVTNTNDAGAGSLRQAIVDSAADDTIDFAVTGTIVLSSGQLPAIDKNLTVAGPGFANLTISGNNSYRVFQISTGNTVNISGLTIADGSDDEFGGGIENEGTLNLDSCVVNNCHATGSPGLGGGIDSYEGSVTITNSTISNCSAEGEGGGVNSTDDSGDFTITDSVIENNQSGFGGGFGYRSEGNVIISGCTFSGNKANKGGNNGGGIFFSTGTLTLSNSTISGNSADEGGGLTAGSFSNISIVQCTITNNTASTQGGGIEFTSENDINIKNTILAANTGGDFFDSGTGSLNSQGYNLCDGALAAFSGTGDQVNATLNIAALADNGGSTKTHALLAGSDAIDAIPEGANSYNGAPGTDQKGTARPQGINADVGAYEALEAPTVTTQAVSGIGAVSAIGNGNITALGSPNPTAHGVCWNTGGNPTTADSSTNEGAASATGVFTSNITGLISYTTYHVRAWAENSNGISYGAQVSFTTAAVVPTVTTQAVSAIAAASAIGNGNITSLGVPNPTAHGVCWNTAGTPTTGDSVANKGAVSATGAFTSSITSLSPNTTYHVRAYATNAGDTVYGTQVSFDTLPQAPTVTTQAVSLIGTTTATGNGNITALGAPNPTAHGVCWNTSGSPTTADSLTNEAGASATGAFTSNITGLTAYTTYYVRAYATNSADTSYGTQVSFTTSSIQPTVTTQAVTAIAVTTAAGNGNITSLGVPNPTAHGMCWNTGGNPTTADSKTNDGTASATGAFTSGITGLTASTTYYVRAYATNSGGTVYGVQVSFTTSAAPPTVTTQAVSAVGTATATGNGNITDLGSVNPTSHGVCWNTGGSPTTTDSKSDEGAASATGAFTSNIAGLDPATTYYVRSYAINAGGTVYGGQVSFTTAAVPPAVMTLAVGTIGDTTATGNGNITALGTPNPTAHGVCWNTGGSPTTADGKSDEGAASAAGVFTSNITGLAAITTYYVRAYAINAGGTVYGSEVSFTTVAGPPTVTTQAVSATGTTSATANGNIISLGSTNPTAHGVCWNTGGTPTTANDNTNEGATAATGSFISTITNLSPNTTYYVRAYATNSAGTAYGAQVSFKTSAVPPSDPPTVSTEAVNAIAATTAVGNGNISALGTSNPTAHGVCWNTSGNPTIADYQVNDGPAFSTGAFTSNMTGLSPQTTYYVRAYATSWAGTAYGKQVSFTSLQASKVPTVTTRAVTDITTTTATGNCNVTNLGVPSPIQHGVCWHTSPDPTISNQKTEKGAVETADAFTSAITGLDPGTTYYVRAYATNSVGTSYGNEISFQTSPALPKLQTLSVTHSGTGNGRVTGVPAGIDCGADCSEAYAMGTVVTLTAAPDDCSIFTGWSGACSGTGACEISMDWPQQVTASFALRDTDGDQEPDCQDADDDNDGLPDEWEEQYHLDPLNPTDAHSDPDHDGLDNLGEYLNESSPVEYTEGPGIPVLISPEDGAVNLPLNPELLTGYEDRAVIGTHRETWWQIAEDPLFETIIFEAMSDVNLTALTVPQMVIPQATTCYFRVCFADGRGIARMWSETRSFTVISDAYADDNGNGIPDDQEIPGGTGVDMDGNGINDLEQDDMKCVALPDGETRICYHGTENIRQMHAFRRLDETASKVQAGSDHSLPFGLLGFRATLYDHKQPAVVTVYSSKPFAEKSGWLKYDSVRGLQDYSDFARFSTDRMSVMLDFTDGGFGDADGCENGILVDPSGPEVTETPDDTDPKPEGGSGGGGCFIRSLFGSP